jgi:hypothetical protein
MNTTEELHSVTTQYVVDNVAAQLHPAPSSSWEASPNVVIQDVREGAKGSKKRCEQRRQDILSWLQMSSDVPDGKRAQVDQGISYFHDQPWQLHSLDGAFILNL